MGRIGQEAPAARVAFSTVLASIVGLWLCYFVLTSMRAQLLGLGFAGEMLWRRALASLAGVAITMCLWLLLRLFDSRPMWMKIGAALLLSLPFSVSLAQANYLIFRDLQQKIDARMKPQPIFPGGQNGIMFDIPDRVVHMAGAQGHTVTLIDQSWLELIELAFSRYYLLLAWCALYLALLTGEKARTAERREQQFRNAARAAELRSLRYQVNPHFLFNTLNSLSALVLTGKKEAAERMIQMLSTFYRRSLADGPTADVTLGDEIAMQKLYLDIEAVRFPMRLQARYDIPPELADMLVPGMILQPLIENSVKHAVAPSSRQVTITLSAREEYGRLVITVADNGQPAPDHAPERPGHGIGLTNVRQRLEARFGNEASIVSGPVPKGYATQLRLPLVQGEQRQQREAAR